MSPDIRREAPRAECGGDAPGEFEGPHRAIGDESMNELSAGEYKVLKVMMQGCALFNGTGAAGEGWQLTDNSKVDSHVALRLIAGDWVGDVTMGFYRITEKGQRHMDAVGHDPAIDIDFDGMAVRWEDLDHSHDDE